MEITTSSPSSISALLALVDTHYSLKFAIAASLPISRITSTKLAIARRTVSSIPIMATTVSKTSAPLTSRQLHSKILDLPGGEGNTYPEAAAELIKTFKENKTTLSGTLHGEPFLHHLVGNKNDAETCPMKVLNIILEASPEPTQGKGDINVPLMQAINNSAIDIAEAIIEHVYLKKWTLEDSDAGQTCLQAAFQRQSTQSPRSIRIDILMKLVTIAKPEVLGNRDDCGLLPLYWAVDFSKCCEDPEQQPKLVELLLNLWEQSVKEDIEKNARFRSSTEPLKTTNIYETFSVYRWHDFTRTSVVRNEGKREQIQQTGTFEMLPEQENLPVPEVRVESGAAKRKDEKGSKGSGAMPVNKDRPEGNPLSRKSEGRTTEKDGLIDRAKKASPPGPQEPLTSVHADNTTPEEVSSKITDMLGHRYLRRTIGIDENESKARTFFHGQYQFTFDMGKEGDLPESSFTPSFSPYKFYRVLRYLTLPHVGVRLIKDKNQTEKKYGYADELFLFQWLRQEKKAQKILKVIVPDKNRQHSDDDIVHVLAGKKLGSKESGKSSSFDVEILDWRKFDICSEIVREAAPLIRELHLYWSGSRNCRAEYGVYQHSLNQVPEASHFLGKYPEISVTERGGVIRTNRNSSTSKNAGQLAAQGQKQQGDLWLTNIKDFSWAIPDMPTNPKMHEKFNNVTIAFIDDGVEIVSDELKNFLQARFKDYEKGLSFDTSIDGPSSHLSSSSEHVTFMVRCILEVCPWANIIPYRLMTLSDKKGFVPSPQPGSAAKAIKAAISEGVDIISMSWTIKQSEVDNDPHKEAFNELKRVLSPQDDKQLHLIFCAASDDGPGAAKILYAIFARTWSVASAENRGRFDFRKSNVLLD
ncbi:uncharacterized protein PAC_18647 [Phialocephala subalpina]|uniref:Peptidase S8/S53 domain-containing protein n=1 Tax=Phialocephala subalpina TaxID=576137 RepID=A0A1L7XUN7_9HELO|nr:uncharacterized protein PAC_18647 [Phialocephala subalpina]